jgi:hypothetical protein
MGRRAVIHLQVELELDDPGAPVLAPCGLETPQSRPLGLTISGGPVDWMRQGQTGQIPARITPTDGLMSLSHPEIPAGPLGPVPEGPTP